jgi:hypothetical protein
LSQYAAKLALVNGRFKALKARLAEEKRLEKNR